VATRIGLLPESQAYRSPEEGEAIPRLLTQWEAVAEKRVVPSARPSAGCNARCTSTPAIGRPCWQISLPSGRQAPRRREELFASGASGRRRLCRLSYAEAKTGRHLGLLVD